MVCKTPVNSPEDLVARIAADFGEVLDTPGILAIVRSSKRRRCQVCITAGVVISNTYVDGDYCFLNVLFP